MNNINSSTDDPTFITTGSSPTLPSLFIQLATDIDFDDASIKWRKNKISLQKGYYKYKCEKCNECVYNYVVINKYFSSFATEFDLKNQNHKNKNKFCEEHLLCED